MSPRVAASTLSWVALFLLLACGDDTETGGGGQGGTGGEGGEAGSPSNGGGGATGGMGGGGMGGEGGGVDPLPAELISLSDSTFLEAETSVAVTPSGRIVAAWIGADFGSNTVIGYAISDDDGVTFSEPEFVENLVGSQSGDPVLAQLPDGTVLLTWLGYDIDFQGFPSNMHAYVASLPQGDDTFRVAVEATDPLDTPELVDKPWIAVTDAGEVVLTYARITQASTYAITASRSTDGITWQQADVIPPSVSEFYNLAYLCPSVGGDRMHVVVLVFDNLGVNLIGSYSDDGGATWSTPVDIAGDVTGENVNFDDPVCVAQGDELTVLYGTLDDRGGGQKDEAGTGLSVVVSTDGGLTFGDPRSVADSTKGPLYLHPAIAQASDGRITITYYEGEFDGDDEGTYVVDSPAEPTMLGAFTTPIGDPIHFTAERESAQWVGDYVGLTVGPDGRFHTTFVANLPEYAHIAYAHEP